jgi:site-specific DNA-cytosine methylase
MKILVLFDGAGLARLGLEQAGHVCVGVELDPWKVHMGQMVGRGDVRRQDVTELEPRFFRKFDAVWASPPCARRTSCIKDLTQSDGLRNPEFQHNYLEWCCSNIPRIMRADSPWWLENVTIQGQHETWGDYYNAAQFLKDPLQCRNRIIGGNYIPPRVFRPYKRAYPDLRICPTITATEYKASGATDKCRASRFYGRNLTVEECAHHQGFKVPRGWWEVPDAFTPSQWRKRIYEAIGDGVPVYMARAFGAADKL